jgi:hypothetical protein
MGWAGRRAVEERFDLAKQLDQILDVLHRAAARR